MSLQYRVDLCKFFSDAEEAKQWADSVEGQEVYIQEIFVLNEGRGEYLNFLHDRQECRGRVCVIHTPSDHHMRDWPLNWRDDHMIMERICEHSIGHPDPDEIAYQKLRAAQTFIGYGQEIRDDGDVSVHGCDGCCVDPARR